MTCLHKFHYNLFLGDLDFDPRILVIGTFMPDCEHMKEVDWFYGEVGDGINDHLEGNHFWSVLPRLYNEKSLKFRGAGLLWRDFCLEHRIAFTDLICSIEDFELSEDPSIKNVCSCSEQIHSNAQLKLVFNDIVALLKKHTSIGYVYFTGQPNNKLWKKKCKPVEDYCRNNNLYFAQLVSPTEESVPRQRSYNSKIYPDTPVNLEEYIYRAWKDKWHPACFLPCCAD